MEGFMTCPSWLKKAYRAAVNFTCEDCHKKETEENPLEIHRIIRGCDGGTYRPGNIKVIHKSCHRRYRYLE